MKLRFTAAIVSLVLLAASCWGATPTSAKASKQNFDPKIAWYGQLQDGLAEAKRSGRPILLVSAAPQCQNVSGMW